MPAKLPCHPAATAVLVGTAVALLGFLAASHPDLRHVDFISFAERARRLPRGLDLVNPQYPVGYPALLALGHAVTGDVLVAGKALAVASAVGLVVLVGLLEGVPAGLWLLAQAPLLAWGVTEGTDLPAAVLSLAAVLAAARRRWGLAGISVGLAFLVRYPAGILGPVLGVAWLLDRLRGQATGRDGLRAILGLLLCTAPHWGLALAVGAPLLPHWGPNLAIAAGPGAGLAHALTRWPRGAWEGARLAFADPVLLAGACCLLVAAAWPRRPLAARAARLLLAFALAHLAFVGLFFGNPRLLLPSVLAAALGPALLLRGPWLLVPALAVGAWNVRTVLQPGTEVRQVAAITRACAGETGPVLSTSPWFHLRGPDGWLVPATPMDEIRLPPPRLTPARLHAWAAERGFPLVVLDPFRVHGRYPALRPLLDRAPPEGFQEVARAEGWRVLRVVAVDPVEGTSGDRDRGTEEPFPQQLENRSRF